MTEPNAGQRAIIEGTEGIYCVDAGAGTGKTFAVTRRYANIVDQPGVEPEDVLLVTFTNNAATEMRDRVVARSSYGMRELRDAPIGTFHGLCHDVLIEHGFDAPRLLGIDDCITGSTRVLADGLLEREQFRTFVGRFADDHPEYDDVFRAVTRPDELLSLVNELAAKGVFPTADGWYRNGERHLEGDFDAFKAAFDAANEPRNDGRKQSRLRSKLGGFGTDRCYLADAPSRSAIRGEDAKAVPATVASLAFCEDRTELTRFVHDVYHGYLEFALSRNYLNFGMLQAFAFVLLCEDHSLRSELAFEYVMVDEFQDTSEIQFELALLLCGSDNLCVVGDWKQSIYAFQYAAVENIVDFEDRLARFAGELNDDGVERVSLADRTVERIELIENYRSTQGILDFAVHGLVVPATKREPVDVEAVGDRIVPLRSNSAFERSRIEAFRHEDEGEAVLTKIQEIVGNDDYEVEEDGELRPPEFGDVALLSRTRDFGRDLLRTAEEYGLPVAYEGGVELFRTNPAKLLLAWLRILEADADRGWAVVLEQAGYTLGEIRHVLARKAYPADVLAFKTELAGLSSVGAVAERVFARYGYDGAYADVVLSTVQSAHDATTMTRGDLIRFVERGIEEGSTREVSAGGGTNAVTVQTIHAAKGLEYPIVIVANMNRHKFPPSGGTRGTITFSDPIGLRQRKVYGEDHGYPHVYDDWRMDVLGKCLPDDYDEERRLLYVAMTRAESHVLFSAGERPNTFLSELPVTVEEVEPAVEEVGTRGTVQTAFHPRVSPPEGPVGLTPHSLMDEAVFAGTPAGEGTEFGTRVHEFAEAYARGEDVEMPDGGEPYEEEPDWEHVTAFVDSLAGDVYLEQEAVLPLSVDGEPVIISGVVDLVHVLPDRVFVIDYKTDRGRDALPEYRKQVSVYWHVLDAVYPDRAVELYLFYTGDGELVEIEPLSEEEFTRLVRERRREGDPMPGD